MPRTYTGHFRVRWTDCDAASRAAFVRYMQEVGFEAGSDAGYGLEYWTGAGVGWLARRSRVDYLRPARYGDELEVTTYTSTSITPRT